MEIVHRQAQLETVRRGDVTTTKASFSSEFPVERYFGFERLVHTPDAVDLSRAKDGLPLLWNHNPDSFLGRVVNFKIAKGRTSGDIQWAQTPFAQEIRAEVEAGRLSTVSIGYQINEMERADGEQDVYDVTSWMPYELTITPVPADHNVGVGRSLNQYARGNISMENQEHQTRSERKRENRLADEERERVEEINFIGERYKEYGGLELARQFISSGKSSDELKDIILSRLGASQVPIEASAENYMLGLSQREMKEYSFTKLLLAGADPAKYGKLAKFELECSDEIAARSGKEARGRYVPNDMLTYRGFNQKRDLVVGTSAAGGATVDTDVLAGNFIELLRNKTIMMQEGMATVLGDLNGNVLLPKQTGPATTAWLAEGASLTESDQTFDQVSLSPKTVGAMTQYSRLMLLQSSLDIEAFVRSDLAEILALAIDLASMYGSGTGNEPTGITNTAGIGAVTFTDNSPSTWPSYGEVIDMESTIAAANADRGRLAYIADANMRGSLKKELVSQYGSAHVWEGGQMNGYPAYATNQMTAGHVLLGNFADLIIALWGGLDLLVDPYTNSASGGIRVVAFQSLDIGIRHPESFCLGHA